MASIRVGISGWTYGPWRGTFFPDGLRQNEELWYASRRLRTIEINGTFYSLQSPKSYALWYAQTPEDFVFAVKAPRFITHLLRLRDSRVPLANFLASGVLRLNEKLGPLLWQLPPNFAYDRERIESFLALLPRTTEAAAALAARHDSHVTKGSWLRTDRNRPLRHAMEVRHSSFETPEFLGLLRKHGVALVVADTAGKWPSMEEVTAGFVYVRLHGASKIYESGYGSEALEAWGSKIRSWSLGRIPGRSLRSAPKPRAGARGRDVFTYFDNDVKVHAPYDAMELARRLGVGSEGTGPAGGALEPAAGNR